MFVNIEDRWVAQKLWPSQSFDLNPIEMPWHDLKRAIHTRHPHKSCLTATVFEWRMVQNSSWLLYMSVVQPKVTFGWVYRCQRRVNEFINPRAHLLFPPCPVNSYMIRSIKIRKLIIVFAVSVLADSVSSGESDYANTLQGDVEKCHLPPDLWHSGVKISATVCQLKCLIKAQRCQVMWHCWCLFKATLQSQERLSY